MKLLLKHTDLPQSLVFAVVKNKLEYLNLSGEAIYLGVLDYGGKTKEWYS